MPMRYPRALIAAALTISLTSIGTVASATDPGNPGTYTLSADFEQGTLVNVNHNTPDQLQLDSESTPFNFIWVAASGRGTIVKIDTQTGAVLGQYWSSPDGMGRNPSRTTVDANGAVWTTNRDEAGGGSGSVVKIGLLENGGCTDRNGNGVIDTSTGLDEPLAWDNAGGVDSDGGVATAADECVQLYVRLPGATNARHVSVNADNNVWVGGYTQKHFYLLDNATGAFLSDFAAGCGGYGGLIDANNVLWSADISYQALLRYDATTGTPTCMAGGQSYGLGIDSTGKVWNALWAQNAVRVYNPDGTIVGQYSSGGWNSRGVVVTSDDDVWIANSASNTVTRLTNAGVVVATIPVGAQPTGVAVDGAGKVWVTNYDSHDVMRIDPATNTVDLTVPLGAGAAPYNYSDMTGSTLIAPPNSGTWTIEHDSTIADATWGLVTWTADTPSDSSIRVFAASSTDGVTFGVEEEVTNGTDLGVANGQYLKVRVTFTRASTGETPVLYDLTILANRPPVCSEATPSVASIWPVNHKFVPVEVLGVTDPDGDAVTITIDSIFQDEPVDTFGDGKFTPDGQGVGTATAEVRAERSGTAKVPGDGRFYHLGFTATDAYGQTCTGSVAVSVPHDQSKTPVDGGALFDSTVE